MPGLPKVPMSSRFDLSDDGEVLLFQALNRLCAGCAACVARVDRRAGVTQGVARNANAPMANATSATRSAVTTRPTSVL